MVKNMDGTLVSSVVSQEDGPGSESMTRYPGGSNSAIDVNVNSTLSLWDGLVTEW